MEKLHPRVVWLFLYGLFIRWFFIALFLSIWLNAGFKTKIDQFSLTLTHFIIPILVFFTLLYVWARLSYYFYRYELTENVFKKEYGVIIKRYVSIPYNRIQNIDIHRGVISRILGLSSIQVQTAGMSGVAKAEGRLPGISVKKAEELRESLIDKVAGLKNQGL